MRAAMAALAGWLVWLASPCADARPFRVDQIPNGSVASCGNCHIYPGGPRNDFGHTLESGYIDFFGNVMWGPALAAIDSDKDGRTNGRELLDPNGAWTIGKPSPGAPAQVTNPGVSDAPPPAQVSALSLWHTLALGGGLWLVARLARRRRTV